MLPYRFMSYHAGVREINIPFAQALDLQSISRTCSPAPALVLWKLVVQGVSFSGAVFLFTDTGSMTSHCATLHGYGKPKRRPPARRAGGRVYETYLAHWEKEREREREREGERERERAAVLPFHVSRPHPPLDPSAHAALPRPICYCYCCDYVIIIMIIIIMHTNRNNTNNANDT